MKKKLYLPLALTAAGILLLAAVAFMLIIQGQADDPVGGSSSGESDSGDPLVGSPLSDFELFDLNGNPVRLSDLQGRPVLINYWTTWCPPCRDEMPLIQDRLSQNPGLIVLAVDSDEDAQTVQAYISQFDYDFLFVLDPDWSVEKRLGVTAYPTSIFVDAGGVVRARYIGGMGADVLDENLAKIGVGQ